MERELYELMTVAATAAHTNTCNRAFPLQTICVRLHRQKDNGVIVQSIVQSGLPFSIAFLGTLQVQIC